MSEDRQTAIRRMTMRSMRRGIKEMDLILSDFAARHLEGMEAAELALYDRLLEENDHDIYGWIGGGIAVPAPYAALVDRIRAGAEGIVRP